MANSRSNSDHVLINQNPNQELIKIINSELQGENYPLKVEEVIRDGSYSFVCSGTYIDDEEGKKEAAIKVSSRSSKKEHSGFKREEAIYDTFFDPTTKSIRSTPPNIVTYFGCIEESLYCYVVMEYLPMSLSDYLKKHPQKTDADWQDCEKICYRVSIALKFLHDNRYIHLDVKPDNVLLTDTYDAKLCDFGLSMSFSEFQNKDKKVLRTGTWSYMAPEVFLREQYSPKNDWYSFGMTIYHICSGEMPFAEYEKDEVEFTKMHKAEERPAVSDQWPTSLTQTMQNFWKRDPKQRPGFEVAEKLLNQSIKK